MFSRLMPTEGRFFELFVELAERIVEASQELASLMDAFDDVQRRCYNIETIEKRGDRITHAAIELLHKTFITPIDRDDIHQLVTRMDDILDLMEDAAQSIYLYDIRTVTIDASALPISAYRARKRSKRLFPCFPTWTTARKSWRSVRRSTSPSQKQITSCALRWRNCFATNRTCDRSSTARDLRDPRNRYGPLRGCRQHHRRHRSRYNS